MKRAQEEGIPVPALDDQPEMDEVSKGAIESFLFLDKSRPVDPFGRLLCIPLIEIQYYCGIFGIKDIQSFTSLMRSIDVKYLGMMKDYLETLKEQDTNG